MKQIIDRLNNSGYTIQDHRQIGMGFYVKNSPHRETGARLFYSSTRNFYVSVSSTERTSEEILSLASALLELGNAAKELNAELTVHALPIVENATVENTKNPLSIFCSDSDTILENKMP